MCDLNTHTPGIKWELQLLDKFMRWSSVSPQDTAVARQHDYFSLHHCLCRQDLNSLILIADVGNGNQVELLSTKRLAVKGTVTCDLWPTDTFCESSFPHLMPTPSDRELLLHTGRKFTVKKSCK